MKWKPAMNMSRFFSDDRTFQDPLIKQAKKALKDIPCSFTVYRMEGFKYLQNEMDNLTIFF